MKIELNDPYRLDRLFPMTELFGLDFQGTKFAVPKGSLFDLFEHQPKLVAKASYEVQSSVPLAIFEVFVKALETGTKVRVTKENAGAISLLAQEFWLEDLLCQCSALQVASTAEFITALSDRISQLEAQLSSHPSTIAELQKSMTDHEQKLEGLDCRISAIERNLAKGPVSTQTPKLPKEIQFALDEAKSLDGIISYLTRKHGGNVHDEGIVTIKSKSVFNDDSDNAARNVGDLTSPSYFLSKNDPGQWVCWDFHELRVCPTDYTIYSDRLKSWVLEGSLDGKVWTEIDRKTNNKDKSASFAVSIPAECRFIRLTQTGKTRGGIFASDYLCIGASEFFGTLLE